MFELAMRTLRFRKGGFVASFVALFFAAAIIMACGALLETGIRTAILPQRLSVADVVVDGDQSYPNQRNTLSENVGLDAALVDSVQRVPGVATAVPDVTFALAVVRGGQPVPSSGHGWASARLAPYQLNGEPPVNAGEVVLDLDLALKAGVSIGDELDFAVRGTTERARLVGTARADNVESSAVFFTDAEARRLTGTPAKVDTIGVVANPGTDVAALRTAVEDALVGKRAVVLAGDDRGLAEFPEARQSSSDLISLAAVFGGMSVMIAMFVVGSTLALLVQQRLREMALLRAIGTTPGQLRRMVLGETMVVAALAIAAAIVPGALLGRGLLALLADSGVVPDAIIFHQGWIPVVAAAGVALATSAGAALIASRSATHSRPTEALAESALQRRWLSPGRLVAALVCLGGALALAIVTATVMTGSVAASTAGPSSMLWAAGLALLGPGIAGVLTAVLSGPLRAMTGFAGQLAMINAKVRKVRLAGAIMPIMLVTGLATALIYLQTTSSAVAQEAFTENLSADAVVTSASGGLPPSAADLVARQPGVAGASALVVSEGFIQTPAPVDPDDPQDTDDPDVEELTLHGVTVSGIGATTTIRATGGSLDGLRGNSIALPTTVAAVPGQGIGSTIDVRFGDGALVKMAVVATFTAQPGYEFGLVPAELLVQHTSTGLVPQVLVRAAPGTDPAALTAALSRLPVPGLRVADRETVTASFAEGNRTGQWINLLLATMIVGYAVISLVNTLIVATSERRREFALQRLIGSTTGQVMRMITVEATLVAIAGVFLGSVVATLTLAPFGIALNGSPTPSGPLWIYLSVVGFAVVLTMAATLIPTATALRTDPIEASTVTT